jgi:hypothetical protein
VDIARLARVYGNEVAGEVLRQLLVSRCPESAR